MHRTIQFPAVALLLAAWLLAGPGALCAEEGHPSRGRGWADGDEGSEVRPASFESEALAIHVAERGETAGKERDGSRALPPRSAGRRAKAVRGDRPSARPIDAGSSLATGLASLAVVLGLLFTAAWALRRRLPAGTNVLPADVVEVLGRAPLAGRQQAHLIRVGNKLLLVALAQGTVETLTEITDPAEIEELTERCQRARSAPAATSFAQLLRQFSRDKGGSRSLGGVDRRPLVRGDGCRSSSGHSMSGTVARQIPADREAADG